MDIGDAIQFNENKGIYFTRKNELERFYKNLL
jgi:hypothetical protein